MSAKCITGVARRRAAQRGVVLILALIVLVAMTLASVALFRTVESGILVAGNIGMQKGAVRAGETGLNTAAAWLYSQGQTDSSVLDGTSATSAAGYSPLLQDPGSGQNWSGFWDAVLSNFNPITLPPDSAGNQVQYVVQRMCDGTGPIGTVNCLSPPLSTAPGTCKTSDCPHFDWSSTVYYRITCKIVNGPSGRQTVSFIQGFVAM
jgi:type IV pilus assembly protein PilX